MTPRALTVDRRRQRGAALLIAMIILTLVSTIAASMVWQQWRAIQVEAAERARSQSAWILNGALDWAGLILREDLRQTGNRPPVDHLGEPWAVPLAEARLSSFLAADRDNTADADAQGPEAFLSGVITDANAKYNLHHLMPSGEGRQAPAAQVAIFRQLCELLSVPGSTADRIVEGLARADQGAADAPVMPQRVEQLIWLGVDPADLKRLEPHVTLVPDGEAKVNLNTASREVIAAVTGTDLSTADLLVQVRQRDPLQGVENVRALNIPEDKLQHIAFKSDYFEVQGEVRLGDRVLRERSLVHRVPNERRVAVIRRERVNLVSTGR